MAPAFRDSALATADNLNSPWAPHDTRLLVVAALGITLIVVLIVWLKVHAFLALTIGSLFVGVFSGTGEIGITKSYENGVGGVLGYVGVLIALGAMLGKLLADSGGADRIVDTLLKGKPAALPWKMALIAAIIGIPMFFEIGLVLLIPVVMLAVRHSGGKAMLLGIPALAGLSVLHGFVPPHRGYKVPSCPKMLPDEVSLPLRIDPRQMNGALALDVPHHLRYRVLRRYRNHHMNVVRHQVPFFYSTFFLFRQLSENLAKVLAQFSVQRPSPAFRYEHDVVFALPRRVA